MSSHFSKILLSVVITRRAFAESNANTTLRSPTWWSSLDLIAHLAISSPSLSNPLDKIEHMCYNDIMYFLISSKWISSVISLHTTNMNWMLLFFRGTNYVTKSPTGFRRRSWNKFRLKGIRSSSFSRAIFARSIATVLWELYWGTKAKASLHIPLPNSCDKAVILSKSVPIKLKFPIAGDVLCGRNRTRTYDLLCVREGQQPSDGEK